MDISTAVGALGALAHDTRLAIYRLLVEAGKGGMPVGDIGQKLDLPPATLSFHLAGLRHAGLITSRRDGRTLYQAADYGAMDALMGYLSENCCGGADCGVAVCAPAKKPRRKVSHEKTARPRRRR